jgi:hypothetical protein
MIIMVGVINYIRLTSLETLDILLMKFYAENLIYISIVSVIILIVSFFIIHRGGIRVLKEIDKITEISISGRYFSAEYTRKLGKLGEKINRLFSELNRLNDMKSLKISAISNLNSFLLENIDLHVLIADIGGVVQACSKRLLDKLDITLQDLKGKNLQAVITDLDFNGVISELEKTRSAYAKEKCVLSVGETSYQSQLVFYPIFNVKSELSNIICISEKEAILSSITRKADQISKTPQKIAGIFKKKTKK